MTKEGKEKKMEYRKTLAPIRADLKIEEREKLEEVLKAKNLTVIGWIREHLEEDYKNL